jgi:mono/diheme cytochrome c family protein
MKVALPATILALGTALHASAAEPAIALKNAPGHEVVEKNCAVCHSLDYSRTNARFLDRKGWQVEVDKMIKIFGANITPQDAAAIVDYLARNYGVGSR